MGALELFGFRRPPSLALPLLACLLCLCPGTTVALSHRAPPRPIALSPVGNLSQAMENVLSVLLFYPEDEAAKKALNQYQAQLGEPRPPRAERGNPLLHTYPVR